ncbi:hypothetical protein BCUN_1659 [Bifidobacterium cuniculi]|uniref:Uncharacterized protein n=1 Tax=Bifidobacterium cuniculi TaxID=1688 RepID=A0A087AKL8_9BIFI|nr:hypothetical protein BCUN_1659 [Bifidobacterium cuniculi]
MTAAVKPPSAVGTLVRLKWALTLSGLKTSAWQVVAMVLAALMALGTVVGTVVGAFAVGTAGQEWRPLLWVAMVVGGTVAILFVMLMQAMVFGEGSTMSMGKFAPFGIPDRSLQLGIILSSLSGVASLAATACLMLWSMAYRGYGAGAVLAQIIMAPCIVILTVCFCKAALALMDTLIGTAGGKSVVYVVVMLLVVTVSQLPSMLMNGSVTIGIDALLGPTEVFSWLPLGCLFAVPFDVAAGAWWAALARVAIAAFTVVACFLVSSWCLHRQRRTLGEQNGARSIKGIGAFARTADSPAGAICARVLSLLRRDVRQTMFLLLPVLFVALFFLQSGDVGPWFPFLGLLIAGWIMLMGEANGLAYDGMGFSMEVIAGVDGRTDRRGRVMAYVTLFVVYFVVLGLVTYAVTGVWRDAQDSLLALVFTVTGFSWSLASLGAAEVFNCAMIYPVPSMDKPFANPQGRMVAQAFIPFLFMGASALVMAPTIGGTLWLLFGAGLEYYPWIMAIALANGIAICALGVWLGAKLLDVRMLKVLRTLERNAALQQ